MKKILALVLALAMILMVGAVFADDVASTTADQTITVYNALIGEDYAIYKMIGATVDGNGAISYKGPIPEDLEDVLDIVDETIEGVTYSILTKKSGVSDDTLFEALKAYATSATLVESQENITATPVVFDNLTPGYYLITSSAGEKFIVTSTTPAQKDVYEKNTTTVEVGKTANDSYTIGDTITYTVTFNGPNYRGEGANAQIVTKYVVTDTLPDFLSDVTVTGISIDDEAKTVNETNFPGVTTFDTDKTFDIPWASGSHEDGYTSLYKSNAQIVITYTAVLTEIVRVESANKNVVTIKPWVDKPDGPGEHEDEWSDDHEIFTYAAALKKVDGSDTTKTLAGAKFQFKGLTLSGSDGIYTVVSYDPDSTEWGTEVEVGEDGMLYIIGLEDALSLTGKETVAPDGYNLLADEITLTAQETGKEIWTASGKRWFDDDDNLLREESSSATEVTVTKSLDELEPEALRVLNNAGTELPHTGGIGTTIFYILGGLLVVGAAVILVARRKAHD
jgi:fimbrial isopeptide formation D2 family protein/LPXTG-motif cell wall-anchored protein